MGAASRTEPHFRFRPGPALATVFLAFALPVVSGELIAVGRHYTHLLPSEFGPQLPWLYAQHGMQLVLALIAIAIIRRRVPADYGLHPPEGESYLLPAALWGLGFGVVMTLVDYGPQIFSAVAPKLGYRLTTGNVIGWLFFQGVYVGPTEEIPFRALLVTYLAATMPGKVGFKGYEMNVAGVFVAALFAIAHIASFWSEPWWAALGQQLYAFALGVLYAYWLEKSKSVLAPIVGHNVSDVTEYALLFVMVAAWG
ncbi:MAG TPA: CPBP family intramembrane glutamic endopeptidase [Rhizomicrobium sp.]|nr:CPBP family intramembrane glutamic endopeptidase [Rhizomicrobium sp.]